MEIDTYLVSSFFPENIGLNERIYVSQKQLSRTPMIIVYEGTNHDGNSFSIDITDKFITKGIVFVDEDELDRIKQFIKLNKAILLSYWNSDIGTSQLARRIKSL